MRARSFRSRPGLRARRGRVVHFVTGDPVAFAHTARVIGGVDGEIYRCRFPNWQRPRREGTVGVWWRFGEMSGAGVERVAGSTTGFRVAWVGSASTRRALDDRVAATDSGRQRVSFATRPEGLSMAGLTRFKCQVRKASSNPRLQSRIRACLFLPEKPPNVVQAQHIGCKDFLKVLT